MQGLRFGKALWAITVALTLGLVMCLPAAAQSLNALAPLPANRVQGSTINDSQVVTKKGHIHPLAQAQFDKGVVSDSTPAQHMILLLQRTPEQEVAAAAVVDELHNPKSPMYHQWLSAEEFGKRFGPSDSDMAVLTNWLQSKGFTVEEATAGRTAVIFSGTTGQMKQAFNAEYHHLNVNGESHMAVLNEPTVPAALSPIIAGFRQLHDWAPKPNMTGQSVKHKNSKTGAWEKIIGDKSAPEFTFNYSGYNSYDVTPQDWFTIYGANPLYSAGTTGAGVTIAVIEETGLKNGTTAGYGNPDIQSFRAAFGLSAYPTSGGATTTAGGINYLNGNSGGSPACTAASSPTSTSEEGEALLDAEWAGAIAPNAIIDYVSCATGTGVGNYGTDIAATYIANHLYTTVTATSLSYGICETSAGTTGKNFYNNLWQQMAAEGITAVVSSGDAGSAGCNQNASYESANLSTNSMSSTAYNISAGGTDFSDAYQNLGTPPSTYWSSTNSSTYGSALSYVPEVAWGAYCANPLWVSLLQAKGSTSYTTTYTPEYLCASTSLSAYRAVVGGQGGISQYNTIPAWQSVYGIGTGTTSSTYRNEPDISFFASSGWWAHAITYCQSDAGYPCTYGTAQDAYYEAAGGTSFVAPAINGLMALINQKYGRQGQANYTFYKLASAEYGTVGSPNTANLANCSGSGLGNAVGSSCIFHDVANDTPCLNTSGTLASTGGTPTTMCGTANTGFSGTGTGSGALTATSISSDIVQACRYSSVTNCYRALSTHSYGLSAVGTHTAVAAYRTAQGYDLATGLGSVNVANLLNNWNSVTSTFTTTTSLAASLTTLTNSTDTSTLTATVTATQRGGVPAGTVSFYIGSTSGTLLGTSPVALGSCTGSAPSVVCTGTATYSLAATNASLASGSNSIIAYFNGDAANDGSSTSSAVVVTNNTAAPASILTPATGSTLTAASTTFTWSASGYTAPVYLWVGTTAGNTDVINAGPLSGTSATFTLPTNGEALYATLWSTVNGTLVSTTATYTAATTLPASLTSPASGSTVSAASTTFTWNANQSTTPVYLWIGTTAGASDLINVGPLSGTSATFNLPTNGATVYATLWSTLNGNSASTTSSFKEATLSAATLSSPASGSTLSAASTTFTWTANGSTTPVYLWVGTTAGASDLLNVGPLSGTSATFNLPTNGATVYATLWSTLNGNPASTTSSFTEATVSPAQISSPANGSQLGSTQTFTWDYNQSTDPVYVWIGTTAGNSDLYNIGPVAGGTLTVNLPTDGAPVYVTLWSTLNGNGVNQTYTYTDPTGQSSSNNSRNPSTKHATGASQSVTTHKK